MGEAEEGWEMQLLVRILSGRAPVEPIPIPNERLFIEFLERCTYRVDSAWKFHVPLMINKEGYVFYSDQERILIRYNESGGPFNVKADKMTSFCFFYGNLNKTDYGIELHGVYRFPFIMELAKNICLFFMALITIAFLYLLINQKLDIVDVVGYFFGIFTLCIASQWFADVRGPTSIFARNTMNRVNSLLARFRNEVRASEG